MSRAILERQYRSEHVDSIARAAERGRKPRDLGEYLTWFSRAWHAEMPSVVHTAAVWSDRVSIAEQDAGLQPAGGSRLGSRRLAEAFRRLMENSPWETEHAVLDGIEQVDEHYVRPVHAALARLAHRRPLCARWLAMLAAADFDWRSLVARRGWSEEEGALFLEAACYLLWREFEPMPRRRAAA